MHSCTNKNKKASFKDAFFVTEMENKMELFEKTIKSEEIYHGKIFRVLKEVVELPEGKTTTRDIVKHNGGVSVIAKTEDGKIPLVGQFRKGIERVSLEIPAGKLENGEDIEECGRRELREETGYNAKKLTLLSSFSPTPAYCSEIIYVYEAEDLTYIGQDLDENEYLNVEFYTLDEIYDKIQSGEIIDAKTIIAVTMMKLKG